MYNKECNTGYKYFVILVRGVLQVYFGPKKQTSPNLTFENGIENVRYMPEWPMFMHYQKKHFRFWYCFNSSCSDDSTTQTINFSTTQNSTFRCFWVDFWLIHILWSHHINYKILALTMTQYLNTSFTIHVYSCILFLIGHFRPQGEYGPNLVLVTGSPTKFGSVPRLIHERAWTNTDIAGHGPGCQNLKADFVGKRQVWTEALVNPKIMRPDYWTWKFQVSYSFIQFHTVLYCIRR